MMVHPRVIALIAVLLLPCVPFVPAAGTTTDVFTFDHLHGAVHESGDLELTGTSTVPLNEVTWELIDASTGIPLTSGTYLDKVSPDGNGSWVWSHNLTVLDPGCSCRFVVHYGPGQNEQSELVLFLGSALSWSPVWLNQPIADVVLTEAGKRTVELPVIFPPDRVNGSVIEMERCPSSSSGVCKSPSSTHTVTLTSEGRSTFVELHAVNWTPEGHWSIESMVVIDNVLSRSASLSWHVLHDKTPPVVSIESALLANESDLVLVVVNATDATSEMVTLVEVRATSPTGEVIVLDAREDGADASIQPDMAGVWAIQATVKDGAGLTQVANHAVNVSNLPPIAGVRLNGAVVQTGDVLEVKLGQPLLLDASTSSDTASDLLGLNHVWWIGQDLRLSGVEALTDERFQEPGSFDVRLEVVDDDGAMSNITFTLVITEDPAPLADAVVLGPLLVLLVGLGLGGLMFARHRKDRASIPTWPSEPED